MIPSLRWDLSNVFPSLESKEYEAYFAEMKEQIDGLEALFKQKVAKTDAGTPVKLLAALAGEAIDRFNLLQELAGTLRAYIQSFVTTDSHNSLAMKKMSEFQMVGVRMQVLGNQFQAWVGRIAPLLAACLAYLWIVFLGVITHRENMVKIIRRTERCNWSLFRLGLCLLEYLLNEEKPIPVAFNPLAVNYVR